MRSATIFALSGMLGVAFAGCNADNCLRAVEASAFSTRSGAADCSSYFLVTVTPATSTVTATTTTTVDLYRRDDVGAQGLQPNLEARQMTVSPSSIPAYASACSGSVRYSSACSCLGVTHATTTVKAPIATTTVPATTSCYTSATIASPTCTVATISGSPVDWAIYYAGQGVTENINNPANDYGIPPESAYLPGTLTTCEAVEQCAEQAYQYSGIAYSFDIHYYQDLQKWECVVYYDGNNDPTYFNVQKCDINQVYGYWVPY